MDQRDIRARIFANHLRVELTAIAQLNFNDRRVINNVVVGDDIAFIGINDDAGTQRHEFLLLAATITALATLAERRALERRTFLAERRIITEELLEITRHTRRINGCATFYVNADH